MERHASPLPSNSISAQLNRLRVLQAVGLITVATGGLIGFIALSRQIPLYALQAAMMQNMQQRVNKLERKVCPRDPDPNDFVF